MNDVVVSRKQFKTNGKMIRVTNSVNYYRCSTAYHNGILYAEFKRNTKHCSTHFYCVIYSDIIDAVMVECNINRNNQCYKGFEKLFDQLLLIGDFNDE